MSQAIILFRRSESTTVLRCPRRICRFEIASEDAQRIGISRMQIQPFSIEQIVGIHHWTPSLFSFTTTRPLELDYLPGQYARIALPVDGRLIWRAFSFVSSPDENLLEFVGVQIPGGLFTSRLAEAQPGDAIHIEHENYGFLTADRFVDGDDLWMLATGTGIGPFVSILRASGVRTQFRRIVLVHGVRQESEQIYRDELLSMSAEPDKGAPLSVFYCVSRPEVVRDKGRKIAARITSAWDDGRLEAAAGMAVTAATSRVMLCGNPQMIEDMRARLHARGLKPCRRMAAGQFLTENYW